MDHDLKLHKIGIIFSHNNDVTDDWGALCIDDLTPKAVAHKALIKYAA